MVSLTHGRAQVQWSSWARGATARSSAPFEVLGDVGAHPNSARSRRRRERWISGVYASRSGSVVRAVTNVTPLGALPGGPAGGIGVHRARGRSVRARDGPGRGASPQPRSQRRAFPYRTAAGTEYDTGVCGGARPSLSSWPTTTVCEPSSGSAPGRPHRAGDRGRHLRRDHGVPHEGVRPRRRRDRRYGDGLRRHHFVRDGARDRLRAARRWHVGDPLHRCSGGALRHLAGGTRSRVMGVAVAAGRRVGDRHTDR